MTFMSGKIFVSIRILPPQNEIRVSETGANTLTYPRYTPVDLRRTVTAYGVPRVIAAATSPPTGSYEFQRDLEASSDLQTGVYEFGSPRSASGQCCQPVDCLGLSGQHGSALLPFRRRPQSGSYEFQRDLEVPPDLQTGMYESRKPTGNWSEYFKVVPANRLNAFENSQMSCVDRNLVIPYYDLF